MKYIFLLLSILFISSCSPRYHVSTEFVQPSDRFGQECVRKALTQKSACENECKIIYSQCLSDAERSARPLYNDSIRRYNDDMIRYQTRKETYDRQYHLRHKLHKLEKKCKKNAEHCHEYQNSLLYSALEPYPNEPRSPDLNYYIEKHSKYCSSYCSCEQKYEVEFQSCGGKIINRQICVANCPEVLPIQ